MIRTYLQLDLLEGQSERLTQLFKQLRILETAVAQPGCHSAELTLSEDGLVAVVTATWDTPDSYTRWTARSDRGDHAARLSPLLAKPMGAETIGGRFSVTHQVLAHDPHSKQGGALG